MKMKLGAFAKTTGALLLLLLFFSLSAKAQFLRTSYFMEGATNRLRLNPALQPTRGYVDIPVIGALNVAASSNSLGTGDIIDVIGDDGDFYNNDKFFNRLSNENRLNVSLNTDVISFGFYRGKSFWSVNVGMRMDIDANVPRSMFDYLRQMDRDDFMWNNQNFDIRNEKLFLNAYTEIGVGYSRAINERLTVGGKVKLLLGMGNLKLNVHQIQVKANNIPTQMDWEHPDLPSDMSAEIHTDATLEASLKGFKLNESSDGYIDDLDLDGFGIGGYGGAIDLGASYCLLNNLTLSAAVLDLGFISWSKESTTIANASSNVTYDENNYEEFLYRVQDGSVLDFDLIGLRKEEVRKSRKSSLSSTLVLGAEYGFFNNTLSVGALSTSRFGKMRTISELTLSANYRPKSWLNTTLSYSMIQSSGKSIGLAVKVGPLMIGTDYMYFGNNTKTANAYLGISIPLGRKKVTLD